MPSAPKKNTIRVRQVSPDPRYPDVPIPVVKDDDEYNTQLGVYQGRCKKAQKKMDEARKAEQEQKARDAEAAKKRKAAGKKKVGFFFD